MRGRNRVDAIVRLRERLRYPIHAGRFRKDRERSESFGDDPTRYDRARPSYPGELVGDLLAANPRDILDIGCGTGIGSRLFQGDGRAVLGVEPDPRMAAVARQQGLDVEEASFEDWKPKGRQFDLLISAQAWHWIEPTVGVDKAAKVLRPGGRFAAFWNHAVQEPEVMDIFKAVYGRHAPHLLEGDSVVLGTRQETIVDRNATEALEANDAYVDIERRTYRWTRSYTVASWLDQLPTHNDHRFLEPVVRSALFDELARELGRLGEPFCVGYRTNMATAVRI